MILLGANFGIDNQLSFCFCSSFTCRTFSVPKSRLRVHEQDQGQEHTRLIVSILGFLLFLFPFWFLLFWVKVLRASNPRFEVGTQPQF